MAGPCGGRSGIRGDRRRRGVKRTAFEGCVEGLDKGGDGVDAVLGEVRVEAAGEILGDDGLVRTVRLGRLAPPRGDELVEVGVAQALHDLGRGRAADACTRTARTSPRGRSAAGMAGGRGSERQRR